MILYMPINRINVITSNSSIFLSSIDWRVGLCQSNDEGQTESASMCISLHGYILILNILITSKHFPQYHLFYLFIIATSKGSSMWVALLLDFPSGGEEPDWYELCLLYRMMNFWLMMHSVMLWPLTIQFAVSLFPWAQPFGLSSCDAFSPKASPFLVGSILFLSLFVQC